LIFGVINFRKNQKQIKEVTSLSNTDREKDERLNSYQKNFKNNNAITNKDILNVSRIFRLFVPDWYIEHSCFPHDIFNNVI